jgi:NTP pyrophosphatase (non-canonical NTP hydrolase)
MINLRELTQKVVSFRDARDWKQFHNVKDIALSLMLEAGEVGEIFQFKGERELDAVVEQKRAQLGEELSDVLYWVLLMAHDAGIDLEQAFEKKLKHNEEKYPVEKSKGSNKKYTEL